MADISQVKLPNGDTYNLVDETSGYIKSYTETDPVFSASAAAGITATDISNWDAKSDTDEKLSVTNVSNTKTYYPIVSPNTSTTQKKYIDGSGFSYYSSSGTTSSTGTARLSLGNSTAMGTDNNKQGVVKIYGISSYGVELKATNIATSDKTIELPNKSGTIALTSDIPQVYSSTNTSGYLTMATLPIYDGTVV